MGGTVRDNALVNLAPGLEDARRVTVAFLVATAAPSQGKRVVSSTTRGPVRLGPPGEARGVACKGCPPVEQRFQQLADGGELWLCPICVDAATSRRPRRCRTRGSWARRRCGSGPATTRPSSATDAATRARGRPRLERRAAPPCSFRDSASSSLRRQHRRPRECSYGTRSTTSRASGSVCCSYTTRSRSGSRQPAGGPTSGSSRVGARE
jgi:hypothetical protein